MSKFTRTNFFKSNYQFQTHSSIQATRRLLIVGIDAAKNTPLIVIPALDFCGKITGISSMVM